MRLRSSRSPHGLPLGQRTVVPPRAREPIGEMLNLPPADQLSIVRRQSETDRLFGETAVELGIVTEAQVHRALEAQQGFSVLSEEDELVDPLVVTALDPDDALARAARDLRSTVTAALRQDGGPVRSVALVGLDADAELPVLAANLAVACAQTGRPTLLVDAQVNHPRQHVFFRSRNRVGVTTLLSGGSAGDLVQPTPVGRLSLMASGPKVPNAPELLDRQHLANAIEPLTKDFDLLIVDAGPSVTAVAAVLGLDATIIVLRRNVTQTRDLGLLVARLQDSGNSVLGTVLVD